MSVMLSHIDVNPQDDVEAELQREDEVQQQELRAFLDEELDDDDIFGNTSFGSINGRSKRFIDQHAGDEYPTRHPINNNFQYDKRNDIESNGWANGNYEDTEQQYGIYHQEESPYHTMNGDINNPQYESPVQHYSKGNNGHSDPLNTSAQLQVLYEARGRKIEKLQKEMEAKEEQAAKENRILNHKLILVTGEKEGALTSVKHLQDLLQQHKSELRTNENILAEEQAKNGELNQQVNELMEKLTASEETIDSLHHQIQQMNQSDSLARARSQHESLLSTMRQKHETEILSLKEKLDDMKQALAWKTEDVNRYREMLDSNSTASEMGILQHRLRTEEDNSRKLRDELENKNKEIKELEEQLLMYENLIKTNHKQMASTPFIPTNIKNMRRGVLDFKTPVSKIKSSNLDTPSTPEAANQDAVVRNELVNALSSNHEKRREITLLREEINKLQEQLALREKIINKPTQPLQTVSIGECQKCLEYQSKIEKQIEDIEKLQEELNEANKTNSELQTGLVNMVKELDKQKIQDSEVQNNVMLKFVDDAKESLRKELERIHKGEKHVLQSEIDKLSGELLYTKEEYVKLCEEMKLIEKQTRDDFKNDSKIELEELRHQMENEFREKLESKENELTDKHLQELETERKKWKLDTDAEKIKDIEQCLALEKVGWIEQYNVQKEKEIETALHLAKLQWEQMGELRSEEEKINFEKMKNELRKQQEAIFEGKLKAAETTLKVTHQKDLEQKLLESKEKVLAQAENKYKSKLNKQSEAIELNLKHKVDGLELAISSQKQQIHKAEVTLQLKESMFLRKETDLKHTIKLLRNEIQELNEKLSSNDPNQSQTSIIFNKIVDLSSKEQIENDSVEQLQRKLAKYETEHKQWQEREKELTRLLHQASEKLKIAKEQNEKQDSVFEDTLLERIESASWMSYNSDEKKRQKSNDEERLSNALELSRQKVASLVALNEQLEQRVCELEREAKQRVEDKKNEMKNVEEKYEECKQKFLSDSLKERKMMDEKHQMEIEKIMLIEESKREKLRNEFQLEHEKMRNNLLREITDQHSSDEIRTLKEKHLKEIRKLKQSFCEKLERISESKKRWLNEEENKRLKAQETYKKEFDLQIMNMKEENEEVLTIQQKHWKAMNAKLKEENSVAMCRLNEENQQLIEKVKEELNLKTIISENEKNNLVKQLAAKQQELKLSQTKHEQLLTKLKALEEASIFNDQSQPSISSQSVIRRPILEEPLKMFDVRIHFIRLF